MKMGDSRKCRCCIGDIEDYRKSLSVREARFLRLGTECERYFARVLSPTHPKESITYMGMAMLNLSLMHLLTEDDRYLAEAVRWCDAAMGYPGWGSDPKTVDTDLSASWVLFGMSLLYDWVGDKLPEEESDRIRECLAHHADILYDYKLATEGAGWSTEYWQNHNWINMTAIAAAGHVLRGRHARSEEMVECARENFSTVFRYLPDDGGNYEGVCYWRYGGMWLFVYAWLEMIAGGTDYFRNSGYLRNTFYYRLYDSSPDLVTQMSFGDCHDRYSSHPACVYFLVAKMYRDGYAQKFGELACGEFLDREAANSHVHPGILWEAGFEFLFYDPGVPTKDFDDLPLFRRFDDLGLICLRSGWGGNASAFAFKCSPPGGELQWREGWRMFRERGTRNMSLSHHHPDNQGYEYIVGDRYFTREDGYNRTIKERHHGVLLVDGRYTDVMGVSDVYMSSAWKRLSEDPRLDLYTTYRGDLSGCREHDGLVFFSAENHLVYPKELDMQEVSRFVLTDRLGFLLFVDTFSSEAEHRYSVLCNTEESGTARSDGTFLFKATSRAYCAISDHPVVRHRSEETIRSIMTPQEPDIYTDVTIHTLEHRSEMACRRQRFVECIVPAENRFAVDIEDDANVVFSCDDDDYRIEFPIGRISDHVERFALTRVFKNGKEL
jgi:hypothetical protein